MPTSSKSTDIFEQARPRLWGIAYRMLGSVADTEDAIQDTYIAWLKAETESIVKPEAWLVSVCTRRCLDMLKSAHRKRVDYVGTWLPEPIVNHDPSPEMDELELAASLTTAFMLLLERLTPTERAIYLLHDVFDYSYGDTARIVAVSEVACRKMNSRLKKHLSTDAVRMQPTKAQSQNLLEAFLSALSLGDSNELEKLLADDVQFWGDGGGKVLAMQHIVRGKSEVVQLLNVVWANAWHTLELVPTVVNGQPGVLLREEQTIVGTLSLNVDDTGNADSIYVVRNPDKLRHIQLR